MSRIWLISAISVPDCEMDIGRDALVANVGLGDQPPRKRAMQIGYMLPRFSEANSSMRAKVRELCTKIMGNPCPRGEGEREPRHLNGG